MACAVTPDCRYVLATSGDGFLRAWRIDDGRQVAWQLRRTKGRPTRVPCYRTAAPWSPSGPTGGILLWSLPDLHPSGAVAEMPDT